MNRKQKGCDEFMNTKEEWESYIGKFVKAHNDMPEIPAILKPITPLIFQYQITDRPEMSYWFFIEENKIRYGMGQYSGPEAPKITHKTDFETMKKVNAGETDPIRATMTGSYVVEGDVGKLMACAALLPLSAKAHVIAMGK